MMLSNNKFELVKKINSELNLNLPADDPFIEFALINYKLNADLIKFLNENYCMVSSQVLFLLLLSV